MKPTYIQNARRQALDIDHIETNYRTGRRIGNNHHKRKIAKPLVFLLSMAIFVATLGLIAGAIIR